MGLREKLEKMDHDEAMSRDQIQSALQGWLSAIGELFGQVRTILEDLIPGRFEIAPSKKEPRQEDLTGSYSVPVLEFRIKGHTLVLSPVALYVIGSYGRVDFYKFGRLDKRYYVLREKLPSDQYKWRIVLASEPRKHPLSSLAELSKGSLESAIENLLGV